MASTSRILVAIVKMCYDAKDWDVLNENIVFLSKRRSQLKQVRTTDCVDLVTRAIFSILILKKKYLPACNVKTEYFYI